MNEPCYYRVSVKALITDELGRFLLAKESDNTWDLLGGGLDHHEDPVAALRREIQEETGLTVTDIEQTPNYFITAYKPEKNVFIANVLYAVKLKDLRFSPSDECVELRFFTVQEAKKINVLPNIERFLEIYTPGPAR